MNDNWLTPPEELDNFRSVAGGEITTDPFWHPKSFTNPGRAFTLNHRYVNNRTVFYNGLFYEMWKGNRIWINCPYSRPLPCMDAVVKYHTHKPEAIIGVLLNSATETKAFSLVRRYAKFRVEFLYRVGFIDPTTMKKVTNNQYSQTLFILGPASERRVVAAFDRADISGGIIHAG